MKCKITYFERVLNSITPLPEVAFEEAVEIIQNYSLLNFLDFCIAWNCFNEMTSNILLGGIIMWEDLDGNYYEEDCEKLNKLYDKVGITEEVFKQFMKD